MSFHQLFDYGIPLGEAAAYFINLKGTAKTASSIEKMAQSLDEFWLMPRQEQRELLKEAEVSPEEFSALLKFAKENEVDLDALLAQEQEGAQAQAQAESGFYRNKSQGMQSQMQAAQQQLEEQGQQLQALQQQVQGSTQQMQQAMQQAQTMQQSSLTNVQSAHQVATTATQQALQATDEALKNQQSAAQMRMAYQGMRGDILNLVSQDRAAGPGAALAGQGQETPAPMSPETGQTSPGADSSNTSDDGNMGQSNQGTGAQGTGQAGTPADAAPADSKNQATAPTEAATAQDAYPSGGASVMKESSVKTATSLLDPMLLSKMKKELPLRLGGAAGGALLIGGATAAGARPGSYGDRWREELVGKVRDADARRQQGGEESVRQGLGGAGNQTLLALLQFAHDHPAAATTMSALTGAASGASLLPQLVGDAKGIYHSLTRK